MNDTLIVTTFVLIDDLLRLAGHRAHPLAQASDSEVLTVAVIAASQFQNHHERALCVLRALGYLSGPLSISRFNRRAHRLADWLVLLLDLLAEAFATGTAFVIDSLPVPVCQRVRAGRCAKLRGRDYCGWCAAKRERFFGWRLHLVVAPPGVPVAFDLLPARLHDLTPVHELAATLPAGVELFGDKAYNSGKDEQALAGAGVALIPVRRANMEPNPPWERRALRGQRAVVEGVNSQLAAWGVQRLHARTNEGILLKLFASLVALACVNAL